MYVSITLPTGSTSLHINIISDTILCLRPCKKSDTLNLLPHVRFAVWIRWVWPRCFSVTLACLPIYINEYICYCSSILLLVFGINPKKLSSETKTKKNNNRKNVFFWLDFFFGNTLIILYKCTDWGLYRAPITTFEWAIGIHSSSDLDADFI